MLYLGLPQFGNRTCTFKCDCLFDFLRSLYGFTPLYTLSAKLPVYSDYSSDWENT